MKKCLKKFIFIPVVSAIGIYFVLQTAFLSYYYFSCVRLKQVEITRWDTTPYKTIIPVKYCRYDRRDLREHIPLFTASGRRYDLVYAPGKSLSEKVRAFLADCGVSDDCMDKIVSIIITTHKRDTNEMVTMW